MRRRTESRSSWDIVFGLAAMSTSTRSRSSSTEAMRRVARRRRGLPIQPVGRHELLGARLFERHVDRSRGVVGAHELHQHPLRAIEVLAEIDEQDALAHLLRRLRRAAAAGRRPPGISRPAMNAAPTSSTTPAANARRAGENTNHENQPRRGSCSAGSSRAHADPLEARPAASTAGALSTKAITRCSRV